MTSATAGWPAENEPFEVTLIDLPFRPGLHPLYLQHRTEVEENWEREIAANPHLFNGQMVLQHGLSIQGGVISSEAYEIPYAMLMWWRRQPDPASAFHLFCLPVPVSSDGAIIAVRMSDHTANPGMVYCPSGSLDLNDIIDGKLDIIANMRREMKEETGLDLDEAKADPRMFATHTHHRVAVFRFYHFGLKADDIIARIETHMEHDEEKEIAGVVAIRSADPAAHHYSPAMHAILDMFFGGDKR